MDYTTSPTTFLTVPLGPDGRPVLPEGWEWNGKGYATSYLASVMVASGSAIVSSETSEVPAPVVLACIADARAVKS